ncbi:transcriptional regulator [Sporosarcina obsidiansis]|uniref:transcriptional regulator n=1 Tax=Sporosarcina obsidiansis TaxID=2660748 RepID=UPI00129BE2D3|nr:transcriptional regulator [Sporosarcina obsidiansis]
MLKTLERAVKYGETLEVMYMAKDGSISKRRVKVLHMHKESFVAYCFLRKAKRTFIIDNVLAAVPITHKESLVI